MSSAAHVPNGELRIAPADRAALIARELWRSPHDRVHAILDAARDPRLHAAILRQPRQHACLYTTDSRALAAVAPYAVELEPESAFTRELLIRGWGEAWGVFVRTPLELEDTRRHFKRFLRARTEDGKTLLFRFYDPRVLRLYLPTCTTEELTAFFGDVSTLVVEAESADMLWSFGRSSLGFSSTLLDLAGADAGDDDGEHDMGATLVVER